MKRQPIDGGGWFDLDSAARYEESTHWDGNNHISNATGSQWEHQSLYCTRKGVRILNSWSQRQGTRESWERVDSAQAAQWLTQNGHEAETPELVAAQAAQEV